MTETDIPLLNAVPRPGTIVVDVDRTHDIIRLTCRGFVTPDQVSESFVTLRRLFEERRSRGRRVKFLVDNRAMSIQSAETADRIGKGARELHEDHHMVALLLTSTLATMQLRRVLKEQGQTIFVDEDEALRWLRAGSATV